MGRATKTLEGVGETERKLKVKGVWCREEKLLEIPTQ